jgi:TonB family protein
LLVGRKRRVTLPIIEEEGIVDFGRGPINAWVLFYQTPDKALDVHQFRISAADMAQARSATGVTLHIADASDVAFQLALMPQLLDGLQTCTEDLKRYWNMDGEKTGTFSKQTSGNLRSIFSSDDYPREAMKRWQQGKGQYLLLVDENGQVAGCQVLLATGVPILDAQACSVIERRAKFTPALDKNGKPVRSTVVTPPINWKFD